jgi:hypothetical protein
VSSFSKLLQIKVIIFSQLFSLRSELIRVFFSLKTEMGRTCSTMGERRGAYRVLVGIVEGRRPLGKPRGKWEDNIKFDLREFGW